MDDPQQQQPTKIRRNRTRMPAEKRREKRIEYQKKYRERIKQSMINIPSEIDRWNRFKQETCVLNDEEMARRLLDHYELRPGDTKRIQNGTDLTRLNNIIEISENLIESQTNLMNEISSHCSEISGYEFHCNKILESCNQILSETLNSSYTVINLCQLVIAEADMSPSSLKNINNVSQIAKKRQVCSPTNKVSTMIDPASLMDLYIDNAEKGSTPAGIVSENRVEGNDVNVDLTKVKVEKDAESCSTATGHYKEVSEMDNQIGIEGRQISSEVENHNEDKTEERDLRDMESESSLEFSDNEALEYDDNVHDDPDWDEVKQLEETKDHDNKDDESESSLELSDSAALEYDDDVNNDPDWATVKKLKPKKVCSKQVKKEKSFKRRKRTNQIGTNDFVCNICDEHFDTRHQLRKHVLAQTDENHVKLHARMTLKKKRQCELCGQVFADVTHFKGHMIRHRGEKNFACDQCDYKGYTKRHLEKHMVRHQTVKEYICYHCGKQFLRSADLTKHLVYHNGVKSFQCNLCPKNFLFGNELWRHKKIHKEDMPHVCEICGKRSRQKYNITVHMRTHTGHKPFSCEICGNKFAHNVSLRQHKKSCHSDMVNKTGRDDPNTGCS